MGLSLSSGLFNEDFNYGYPYDKKVADSAPEFEYSGEARTPHGLLTSSWQARKQFTLHYQNHRLQPRNYDVGIHGGSHDNNYYYVLFPLIQWDQVQILTLKLYLSAPGVLTFDKGFDGYHKDRFYLVVNDHMRHLTSHSAGHGWHTMSTNLGQGLNVIHFVLKSAKYVPPKTRGHTALPHKPPNLPRYLRLTSIQVTNVQSIIDAPHCYAKFLGDSSMTATANIAVHEKFSPTMYTSFFEGYMSGAVYMTGQTTFITDWLTERDEGRAVLKGESALTANASVDQNHEAYDGGIEMGTTGELSIFVPIDHQQTIAERTKVLTTTYFDYSTPPVVIGGKLIVPAYRDTQTSTITSAHSYTYADAPAPTDTSTTGNVLPVAHTLRWIATDISASTDQPFTLWPEHTSPGTNPGWVSSGVYRPTVHPHEHFSKEGLNLITYSKVAHTWWRYAQHMWINLGSVPAHYTWQFVMIVHPVNKHRYQWILDNGVAPPADYTDQINADKPVRFSEDASSCGFGMYTGGLTLYDSAHSKWLYKKAPVVTARPQVITVVYGDNTIPGGGVTVYQHGHRLDHRVNTHVPVSTDPNFILGRAKNIVDRDHASHLSIMEIEYFDHALTAAQVKTNAKHLMGVYHFSRYK